MVDSPLRARALGSLFLAGATIGLVSLLLPHSAHADDAGLYSNVALAYLGGVGLLLGANRTPAWIVHAALIAGVLLITRAILLSGEAVSFYSVWFIWVGLFAFYFFERRLAAGYVALVALLYGVTLLRTPASTPFARWLTTVATLIVAGGFIDTLVRRARREASAAAAAASRMGRVAGMAHELASMSDSGAARPALCEASARVTAAEGVALWEPTPDGTALRLSASAGRIPTIEEIPFAGPPAGALQAFTSASCASANLLARDQPLAPEFAGAERPPAVCLWQPILRSRAPVGVLGLYWDDPNALADPGVLSLTDLLTAEVAVTLERISLLTRLEVMARTDELTGLPNRRAWQEELPREIARAERSGDTLCVAMLDLDRFKRYNDDFGHQAGDRLLKEVAGAWIAALRATDTLARYGGEEFALALPACSPSRALEVVERLCEATPGGQTCSAGIAVWDGSESAGEVLGRADWALYHSKRNGRDRITLADRLQPDAPGLDL